MSNAEARRDAVAWVAEWIDRPALRRLVNLFDGPPRGQLNAEQWLAELEEFSELWDYRRGKERNLVQDQNFSAEVTAEVTRAAEELGLRGPAEPAHQRYDAVIILGGLVRASLARPAFAAGQLELGVFETSRVIALGGHRELAGDEIEMAERLIGAHATDELDAMTAGVQSAFGLSEPSSVRGEQSDRVGASWTVREYQHRSGMPIDVVAAPSSEPGVRRANTADTYEWLAGQSHLLKAGDLVLIITTKIYAPFQEADAWRMLRLPHDVHVDLVGIDPGAVDARLEQKFLPHQYLQETRSAIRGMRMLLDAARSEAEQP